jgi:hypothetical protein
MERWGAPTRGEAAALYPVRGVPFSPPVHGGAQPPQARSWRAEPVHCPAGGRLLAGEAQRGQPNRNTGRQATPGRDVRGGHTCQCGSFPTILALQISRNRVV